MIDKMKKNFIYNLIYQLLVLILPLITVPYISRVLGAEGIGTYSYTYSIAYYFMILAMLGLNNYGNRTIAKVRDDKIKLSKEFYSIYYLQLMMSITMVIIYLFYVMIFDNKYKIVSLIQMLYVVSSCFDVNWFFFGIEKFKLTITRNTIVKILSLILIFTFVKTPNDVWKYTLILAGSTLSSNLVLMRFLHRYIKFEKVTKSDILKHFKPCLILFLPVIAVSIYKIMDKIMLGILSTVREVGYYENSEKIINMPLTIITALGTVMLPRVSNMLSNNREDEVKKMLAKTMPFIMFLSLPMVFGITVISKEFSILFFGKEFEKSGNLIQLLSITILFLSWGNVIRTQYLIPKERDKEYIISAFLGAIINFIMNLIFIPRYRAIGACIGTITAEFVVMFYQSWKVKKELPLKKYIIDSVPFLIKSIIMLNIILFLGLIITENMMLKLILQVFIGILVYGLLNIKYILKNIQLNIILNRFRKGKTK